VRTNVKSQEKSGGRAPHSGGLPRALSLRLRRVELLLCDVDGVLTDGSILVGEKTEMKSFHIQDGLGLGALRKSGIRVGWISNRLSVATAQRAKELRIDFLRQERRSKVTVIEELLGQVKLSWNQVCYVGDDIVDLGPLKRAGVGVAVANAVSEVMGAAHYVTSARGGGGAIREVCELILKAKDLWRDILTSYSE
jgi:3-deoxy-D-manno-octulosonate 8-phosphate phosphatase (KDO 8-P phosphatase)